MIKKLALLFINSFIISSTANSGYAIISYMRKLFVEKYKWFSKEEMDDFTALAQSSPGPIAVNACMLIGYHSAGILGSFAAVCGVILPPFFVMLLVTFFYSFISENQFVRFFIEGMQAGVIAMLIDVLIGLFTGILKQKQYIYYLLILFSFIFIRFTDYSVFYLAIICIVCGVIKSLLIKEKVVDK